MNTNTASPLLPFDVTINGSIGICMARDEAHAAEVAQSATEANRDLDPGFFAQMFGTSPQRIERIALRADLV